MSIVLLTVMALVAFLLSGCGTPAEPSAATAGTSAPTQPGTSPARSAASPALASISPSASKKASPAASKKKSSPAAAVSPQTQSSPQFTLLSALSGPERTQEVAAKIDALRVMNYYPAANSWTGMWTNWSATTLNQDFARIRGLGANAVRITVFPSTFGYPTISATYATRFANTLKIAAANGLAVQLTLFDWWGLYTDTANSQAWLKSLLAPYAADPEIQLVELKNEVDPADSAEVAWVAALLPTLRSVMPRTPSTVSVSGTEGPAGWTQLYNELGGAPLDVADLHFYGDDLTAYSWMLAAKQAAGALPLFIGEAGYTDVNASNDSTATALYTQAHWFSVVFAAAKAAGVATPAPWTLYNFAPGTIPAEDDNPADYYFGLYSPTGQWEPSVSVVQQAFAGGNYNTSNLNFSLTSDNLPLVWNTYFSDEGKLAYDPATKYLGSNAVSISAAAQGNSGSPSFFLVPTNPVISGQTWTVSAMAKGSDVNGTAQVSLSWYNSAGTYIGLSSGGALPQGNPGWTKLSVSAKVPAGAVGVQVYLKSDGIAGTVWFAGVKIGVS
jgi:hypothetical protein